MSSDRNGSIEILRIASCLSVIYFHIVQLPHRHIAYSGLIIFVILLAYFNANQINTTKLQKVARLKKLTITWLAWFCTYETAKIVTYGFDSQDYYTSYLLTGAWIGLWFLPFAIVSTLLLNSFKSRPERSTPGKILWPTLSIAALILVASFRNTINTPPWPQWVHAAPALFFGVSLSRLNKNELITTGVALTTASIAIFLIFPTDKGLLIPYIISTPLILICITIKTKAPKSLLNISQACLGVYLVHGAIIAIATKTLSHTSYFTTYIIVSFISFSIVVTIRKIPAFKAIT